MGNFCAKPKMREHDCPPMPQQEEQPNFRALDGSEAREHGHNDHHISTASTTSTRSNTPFLRTPDLMRTGAGSSSPSDDTTVSILEPRLLSLLEFFRQLHVRREAIFRRIIPVHREDFEEIFNNMGNSQEEQRKKSKKMGVMMRQRSMSVGNGDEVRLQRFKVKPIDSGGSTPPDGKTSGGDGGRGKGGGGGTSASGGTKPSGKK